VTCLGIVELHMSPEQRFYGFCIGHGRKLTARQSGVVRELFKFDKPFRVVSLLAELADAGVLVSRATLFRTIGLLNEAGMVRIDGDTYTLARD